MVAELLELCGYEAHEMDSELPRAHRALNKLGINAIDVERGKERLTKYYDIQLDGIRKILGIYMRELIDLLLAREEGKTKTLYGRVLQDLLGAIASASRNIQVADPDVLYAAVLGCIFGKLTPILEAAEAKWLPPAAGAHCSFLKLEAGLYLLDLIPNPDLFGTGFPCCDEGPKTADLLHEFFGVPVCYVDWCMDREFQEYPNVARDADFVAKSMRKCAKTFQKVAGVEITDEMFWETLKGKERLAVSLAKLEDLIEGSDPLPISAANAVLWQNLMYLPLDANTMKHAIDAVDTLCEEVRQKIENGVGVVEKGAPRIFCHMFPSYTDPRLEHLLEEIGIGIAGTEALLCYPYGEHQFFEMQEQDPYLALARSSFHVCNLNPTRGRISIIIEACKRAKVDGVLLRFHVGCRALGVGDTLMIRDAVKKELEIPTLVFEWEGTDPRVYDYEGYKRKLEPFAEAMRARKR